MRRSVLSAILAATLLFACSEQPTEPTNAIPPGAGGSFLVTSCTASDIKAQIDALFPAGKLRNSAQSMFSSFPKKTGKTTGTALTDKTFEFIGFLLHTYYAGQLTGGTSTPTFDKVLKLIQALYCFAGLTPPDLPSTTGGADIVVGVVFPNSPTTTLVVPSEHAAVTIPTGAAPSATTIVIQILPDEPQPLRTSLDQYPFFYHFSGTTATGPVTFNLDVTAGICLKNTIDVADANLRLAHNVGPNFGDVEILPRPTGAVPGLDCSDLGGGGPIGSIGTSGRGAFAWAEKLFLPAELHAASVTDGTTGVGGTTKKFSEFGIVDIFSNPGAFNPVGPTSSTETGGSTVTRTVLVTSDNGHSIYKAPVTFTTEDGTLAGGSPQTVLTDGSGNASVSWTLPSEPGTYTLTADVPEEDNNPLGTTDPPSGNVASTPDVAFDPMSLTFTATATTATPVSSSLELIASSNAGGVLVEDTKAPSQGATLNQLSATVNASAVNGAMSILTKGSAVATWQGGGAGQIVFTDFGWNTVGVTDPLSHAHTYSGTDWTYTFTANTSGTFNLDYDVTKDPANTDDFGLQGFVFWWAEGAGSLQFQDLLCFNPSTYGCAPTTTGTRTKSVVAGTTYTVRLENAANIFGALGSRTAFMSGTFGWSVTPAPIILLSQSVRPPSGVVAPLATTQLQCEGTQRRVCTRTYQGR